MNTRLLPVFLVLLMVGGLFAIASPGVAQDEGAVSLSLDQSEPVVESNGDKLTDITTQSVDAAASTLSFDDQGIVNGTVTVSDVNSSETESAVIITYEGADGPVIAGLETGTFADESVTVDIEDDGGFPGEHTAHLVAVEDLSGEYEPGDSVSADTAGEIVTAETGYVSVVVGDMPATDTTGDGLLNDVTGDGATDIADIQLLFENLDNQAVQDNAALFDFAGVQDDRVTIFDVQALFNQEQTDPVGELEFADQATASATFTDDDPTDAGVVVESVSASTASAVVLTYDTGDGAVIAGVETVPGHELNGDDVTVPVEDADGFPGTHTAHVIPAHELSEEYAPGDTVSDETAGAVVDATSATVFEASVALDDQAYDEPTDEVELAAAELAGDDDALYVVDLHETDEAGAPGAFVGSSPVVSGDAESITIDLQDTDGEDLLIDATDEYVAMVHLVDDDEVEAGEQYAPGTFPVLPNADATDGFVPGGVTDAGTVDVAVETDEIIASMSDESAEVGESVTATFDITAFDTTIEGYDLSIQYDSDVLAFQSAESEAFEFTANDDEGVLNASGVEAEDAPSAPIDAAMEVTFEAIDSGTSSLAFDVGESALVDGELELPDVEFTDGTVAVESAPETAASDETDLDAGVVGYDVMNALESASSSDELALMVSLERGGDAISPFASDEVVVEELQSHAETTQGPVVTELATMGVEVRNQFWLGNSLAVTAPADADTIEQISALPSVQSVTLEQEYELPEPVETDTEDIEPLLDDFGEKPYTAGLEQSNVPNLWENFDTQGEGASIAILDDGIDDTHPDIDLTSHVAVTSDGEQNETAPPAEASGHGTHVAATATGGDASGTAIGVAPDADLYFGDVFVDGATESAIVSAMEWSAENDVDVVSASLGLGCSAMDPTPGYSDAHIDGVQDLMAQDIVFVSSAGNGGEGCVSDPGNHYDSFSIGASDRDAAITDFSSGGLIDKDEGQPAFTESAWEDPPGEWPQSWVAPDVSAHGNAVISAATAEIGNPVPGSEDERYRVVSGTSMSAPHVSGTVTLLRAVQPDASIDELEEALEETAFKPGDWDESEAAFDNDDSEADEPGVDSRYGHGIIDADAAAQQIGLAPLVDLRIGDVTEDGELDLADQLLIQESLVGLALPEEFNERLADLDRDGDVTIRDAVLLARNIAGIADEGDLQVSNLEAPTEISGDETALVTADVENVGDIGDVQNLELRLAEDESDLDNPEETTVVDSTIVDVAPGAVSTAQFTIDTSDLPGGDFTHAVFSDDSSQSAEITITRPFFEVTEFDAPAQLDSGEELTVDVTLENTGNVDDTQLVTYDPPGDAPRSDEFVRVAVVDSATSTSAGVDDADAAAENGSSSVEALAEMDGTVEPQLASDLVSELEATLPDEFLFETVSANDLPDEVNNFDVFLVNDLGDSSGFAGEYTPPPYDLTEEFYDELDPETQGAIYMDAAAFIDQGNAVQALALDDDRPIGMEPADFNIAPEQIPTIVTDPVEFEVTNDHPIFDGIAEEGERFTAYQPPDGDRVWFDDYNGEFVAETALEGQPTNGSTIGINEERNEIVMGLGFNEARQPVEAATNDSIALLANAIDHVAVDVDEGEDDIREISLDAGESVDLTFTADTEDFPDATFEHGMVTDDDEQYEELKVNRWFFDVDDVIGPEEVAVGDDISVDATVTNTGNATDEQLIQYDLIEEVPDIAVVGGDSGEVDSPRDTNRTETIVDVLDAQVAQPINAEAISYEQLPDVVDEYDTFVIHRFGSNNSNIAGDDRATAFLEELGENQNAVYLETAGSAAVADNPDANYASAIERLVNVRDDPTSVDTDTVGLDGSPLTITASHPIWTGVGIEGDTVTTNVGVGTGQDYAATFDEYGGDVIGDDTFFEGPGVAVDDAPDAGEREVLLTNAVPYEFVELPDEMTEEGQRILANAVEYAAFGDVAPAPDSETEATPTETSKTVELDPDESTELTFNYTVSEEDPIGSAEHFVGSDDDDDAAPVTVATAEQVNVIDVDAPVEAQQADNITVNATVEHVGSDAVTEEVVYLFDDEVFGTEAVALEPGDTETVSFEAQIPEVEPGEYVHGIELSFDESFLPIQVEEGDPSEFTVDEFDAPQSVGQGGTFTATATIENVDPFLSDTQTVDYEFDLEGIDPPLQDIEVLFIDEDTEGVLETAELVEYLSHESPLSDDSVETLAELDDELTVDEFEEYLETQTELSESEIDAVMDDVAPEDAENLIERIDDELDDEMFNLTGIDAEDLLDNLDADIYLAHDLSVGDGFADALTAEEFDTFLEAVDGPEQGVVYLDQDSASVDGVESLVEFRDDPTDIEGGEFSDPDENVMLHIEDDHPIFSGIGTAGDVVELIEVRPAFGEPGWSSPDRLWFDGYTGETLADVGIDGEPADGPTVGIDDERGEILLASSGTGSSFSQEAEYFSDDAISLIGNSVEHLAQEAILGTSTSQVVSLDAGESTEVEFEITVPVEQAPETYEHGIFTMDDEDTGEIEVLELNPQFVVTSQDIEDDEVIVGQNITTEATVINEGAIVGEEEIALEFDGETVDTEMVELESGEVKQVELSAMATNDQRDSTEVTVNGAVPETVAVDPSGTANGTVFASGDTAQPEGTPGDGEVIENATVYAFPDDPDRTGEPLEVATTDEDGEFETVVLPLGEHGVEVDAPGFEPFEGTVEIQEDEVTELGDIELDYAEAGEVSGEVDLDFDLDIELSADELSSIDVAYVDDEDEFLDSVAPEDAPAFVSALDERLDDDIFTVEGVEAEEATDRIDEFDVFVIQSFGGVASTDLLEEFLDELHPNQAAVYLDQNGGFADAIEDLQEIRDNPGVTERERGASDGEEAVEVEVTQDHPIFDGLAEEGERFEIIDGDDAHFWFDDYSGDVIGEVGQVGEGLSGPNVAVDDDNNEVLLGSVTEAFGPDFEDYTEDGLQLLANAVEHAATQAAASDPALGGEDQEVDVTVEVEETGDSTTVTAPALNATVEYTIDDVDVNVDDGYTVTATATDYVDATAGNVTVDVGTTTEEVDLTLTRETGGAAGSVVDVESDPVENATITVYTFQDDSEGEPFPGMVFENATDENGEFELPNGTLPVGDHFVVAEFDGDTTTSPATIEADEIAALGEFALPGTQVNSVARPLALST